MRPPRTLQSPGRLFVTPWIVVLILVGVAGLVLLLSTSFWRPNPPLPPIPDLNLENYRAVLSSDNVYRVTLLRTGWAVLLALVPILLLAVPSAYALAKKVKRRWLKLAILLILALPFFAGPMVRIIAITGLLSINGAVNTGLGALGLIDEPIRGLLFSRFAVMVGLVYNNFGLVLFPTWLAFEQVRHDEIAAARDLGAGKGHVFWRVIAPRATIGILAGIVLVVVSVSGSFLEPQRLGGTTPRMAADVITSQFLRTVNWPLGSAIAVALVVMTGVLLVLLGFLAMKVLMILARRLRPIRQVGSEGRKHRFAGRSRVGLSEVTLGLLVLFVLAPLVLIVMFSFNTSPFYGFPIEGLSLRWYKEMASASLMLEALMSTVIVGVAAGLTAALLGSLFAYGVARYQFRGRAALTGVALIPFLVPTLVLGIALQMLFVRSGALSLGYAATVLGHALYLTPFVILVVWAWLGQVDWIVESAARDLGASYGQTLRWVTWPAAWVGVRSALILAFLLSFNDYNLATFLARGFNTLPVYVSSKGSFGIRPDVLALASLIIVGVVVSIGLASPILERLSRRGSGGGGIA